MKTVPTPTRYRTSSNAYKKNNLYSSTGMYSGTSTAYDFPIGYPEVKPAPGTSADVRKRSSSGIKSKQNRANRSKITKAVMLAGALFLLCITVLYRYGIILTCNQQIKQLETQRDEILASNQAAQAKIDKQFEMNEIEKYAKENLGMMKPQSYQIFYIDMNMKDEGSDGTVTSTSSGTLSGVPGVLVNAFRVLK